MHKIKTYLKGGKTVKKANEIISAVEQLIASEKSKKIEEQRKYIENAIEELSKKCIEMKSPNQSIEIEIDEIFREVYQELSDAGFEVIRETDKLFIRIKR